MKDFSQPTEVDQVTLAFPADIMDLMPVYEDIPEEFMMMKLNPYVEFQKKWFMFGLKEDEVPAAKEGIDQTKAIRHLMAIQGSFQPRHEHKVAAVAYLASLWLEEPEL